MDRFREKSYYVSLMRTVYFLYPMLLVGSIIVTMAPSLLQLEQGVKYLKELVLLFITSTVLTVAKCSLVIDKLDSFGDDVKVHDYCPNITGCDYAGSHVLCVNNPNIVGWFGPRCHSPKNISVTESIAVRLLSVFNAIRKKIALGTETGLNGDPLPKGYGIQKLEWDPESALFAQIWANQCVFSEDICHVTQRFQEPGQLVGKTRFYYPSWQRLFMKSKVIAENSLPARITHAIIGIARKWYKQKDFVDYNVINRPEMAPPNSAGSYLQIINGKSTHVGCGVSNYVEYVYNHEGLNDYLYHVIELVCNFSHKIKNYKAVYSVDLPNTAIGESPKCGCPPGTTENEESCLCYINSTRPDCSDKYQCKPKIIYLPIVSVADAPKDYLPGDRFKKQLRIGNRLKMQRVPTNNSMEMNFYLDMSAEGENKVKKKEQQGEKALKQKMEKNKRSNHPSLSNYKNASGTKNRSTKASPKRRSGTSNTDRKSIFTRAKPFELPSKGSSIYLSDFSTQSDRQTAMTSHTRALTKRIKDVNHDYLNSRRPLKLKDHELSRHGSPEEDHHQTSIYANKTSKTYDRYFKNNIHYNDYNVTRPYLEYSSIKNLNEDSNGKVIKLLDNLEQEVKYIRRNGNGVFENKMNKIYETITTKENIIYNHIGDYNNRNFAAPEDLYSYQSNSRLLNRPEINERIRNTPIYGYNRREINPSFKKKVGGAEYHPNYLGLEYNRRSPIIPERIQEDHDILNEHLQRETHKKRFREAEYDPNYSDLESNRKTLNIPRTYTKVKSFLYDQNARKINSMHKKNLQESEYFSNHAGLDSPIRSFRILEPNKNTNDPLDPTATEIYVKRKHFENNEEKEVDSDEYKIITRPLLPQLTTKEIRYDVKRTRYADLISRQNIPEVAYNIENNNVDNAEFDRRKFLQEKLESMRNKLMNIRKYTRSYNFDVTRPTRPVYRKHEELNLNRHKQLKYDEVNEKGNEQLHSNVIRNARLELEGLNMGRKDQPTSDSLNVRRHDLERSKKLNLLYKRNDQLRSREWSRRNEKARLDELSERINEQPKSNDLAVRWDERARLAELDVRKNERPRLGELNVKINDQAKIEDLDVRIKERPRLEDLNVRRNERPRLEELNVRIIDKPKTDDLDDRRNEQSRLKEQIIRITDQPKTENLDVRINERPRLEELSVRINDPHKTEDLDIKRNVLPRLEELNVRTNERPRFEDLNVRINDQPKTEVLDVRRNALPRHEELNVRINERPRLEDLNVRINEQPNTENLDIRRNDRPRLKELDDIRNEQPGLEDRNVGTYDGPKPDNSGFRRNESPVDKDPIYVAGRARTLYGF